MRLYRRDNLWWVSYPGDGVTVRRSTGRRDRAEAEAVARQLVPAESQAPRHEKRGPRKWLHSSATIYVLEAEGTGKVKIGHVALARDLQKRVMELQCGCPFPLILVTHFRACRREERLLHVALEKDRISPKLEWFRLTEVVRARVTDAASGVRLCGLCRT